MQSSLLHPILNKTLRGPLGFRETEMKICDGGSKLERKTVEKNRRIHMKNLCFKLSSLIPKDHNFAKNTGAQLDHLDQAAAYINRLRERIERLKQRKLTRACVEIPTSDMVGFKLPVIEVRHMDSSMEVAFISELKKRFMFHEVISVLVEEGAEVINASFYVANDKIFHTIHSHVDPRIGLEASRVLEILKELLL